MDWPSIENCLKGQILVATSEATLDVNDPRQSSQVQANQQSRKVFEFVNKLKERKVGTNLFNPFADVCPVHDLPDAPAIRRRNLETLLLSHLKMGTSTIWLFEAPSYMGARRSGAPFVNEGMYAELQELLQTHQCFEKATVTDAKTSMTSRLVWNTVHEIGVKPLIWESIPFHPYRSGNFFTNRKPSKAELVEFKDILEDLFAIFCPVNVVAIGRSAENALKILGISAHYARHPAQGGYRLFQNQIRTIESK